MKPTDVGTLALQVLLPGFAGTTLPDDYRALLEQGLGGICYFGSNTADGPEAVAALSATITRANPHAVIAVDEEGGDVSRLHTREPSPVLGAAALGAADDLDLTEAVGGWVGTELAAVGITLDLAPDADVNSDPDNPVIGTRSFGTDAERVAAHAVAWTRGLQATGVAACAKHFPGHGDTATDSHLALPTIDVDTETLVARELVPFAAVVDVGVAAVMTSHIVVPALDDRPATLSPVVLALLRDRLGFDGVIVSDALDMAGASGECGVPEAAVRALAAGCDLLCIGPDKPASLVEEVRDAIVGALDEGRLAVERLTEAVGRVRGMGVAGSARAVPDVRRQVAAAASALVVDGDLPDLTGGQVVSVETVANIAVGAVAWGLAPDHRVDPSSLALPAAVPDGVPVVVQVRDAHRRPDVLTLLRSIAASGRPAVVVEWGWPGAYDTGLARISTRGSSGPGVVAVTELLREAGWER